MRIDLVSTSLAAFCLVALSTYQAATQPANPNENPAPNAGPNSPAQHKRDLRGVQLGITTKEAAPAFAAYAQSLYKVNFQPDLAIYTNAVEKAGSCAIQVRNQWDLEADGRPKQGTLIPPGKNWNGKIRDSGCVTLGALGNAFSFPPKCRLDYLIRGASKFECTIVPPPSFMNGTTDELGFRATSTYKRGTIYLVHYEFSSEAGVTEIITNVTEQFGVKPFRVMVRSPVAGKELPVFIWDLGEKTYVKLSLSDRCYMDSRGIEACEARAPRGQSYNYYLDLYDQKLIALENEANSKATPQVNPKPKL